MNCIIMSISGGGVPPNFADALIWAKRNNLDETYASLLIRTAEGFANSGNIKEAESTLKELAPVVRRVLGPIHPTTREVESTLSVIARYRNAAGGGNLRIVIAGAT